MSDGEVDALAERIRAIMPSREEIALHLMIYGGAALDVTYDDTGMPTSARLVTPTASAPLAAVLRGDDEGGR